MQGRPFLALASAALVIVGSACSTAAPGGSSAPQTQPGTSATIAPVTSPTQAPGSSASTATPATSTAPPATSPATSQSPGTGGDDCETRRIAASDAQNTMVLLWETIDYQVETDADWAEQVGGGFLDIPKYRAAVELSRDLPDIAYPSFPDYLWSEYVDRAEQLATLLEQAEASGTPFADGIGDEIRDLAMVLRAEGMWAIYGSVEGMCKDPSDDLPAAGVDELLAKLVPPNSTETSRFTSPTLSTVDYTSSDSMAVLTTFYESAIPATGWEVFWTDKFGDSGKYWDVRGATAFRWQVTIDPADPGPGTDVSISFYGGP